jgi:hypothetical protein
MSGLTTQSSSHQANNKELVLMRKFMIATEFILHSDLEDQYVEFLYDLLNDSNWSEFHPEIQATIEQFEITEIEITNAIKDLIKVPKIV